MLAPLAIRFCKVFLALQSRLAEMERVGIAPSWQCLRRGWTDGEKGAKRNNGKPDDASD